MPPIENWLPVVGYEGYYEVSDAGNVRSVDRQIRRIDGEAKRFKGRTLTPLITNGRRAVTLARGTRNRQYIATLMARAFIGPRPEGNLVRHLDDCLDNEPLSNVAYGTPVDNSQDALKNGRNHNANKLVCIRNHKLCMPNLKAAPVKRGHKECLACSRAYQRLKRNPFTETQLQIVADQCYAQIMGASAP